MFKWRYQVGNWISDSGSQRRATGWRYVVGSSWCTCGCLRLGEAIGGSAVEENRGLRTPPWLYYFKCLVLEVC